MSSIVIEGRSGLVNLAEPDAKYKKYQVGLTLDDDNHEIANESGMKVTFYEGKPQIVAKTNHQPSTFDKAGNKIDPALFGKYGDLVRIVVGKVTEAGTPYFNKAKLVEEYVPDDVDDGDF